VSVPVRTGDRSSESTKETSPEILNRTDVATQQRLSMLTTKGNSPLKPVTCFQGHHDKLVSLCISIVIIFTLSVQYYAGFASRIAVRYASFLQTIRPPKLWPFLDYPMYAHPYYVGDVEDRSFLFGVLDDSTEVLIHADDLGLCGWHFRIFSNAVRKDDLQLVNELARRWEKRHSQKLVGLRLENHPLVFSGSVMKDRPPQIVKTMRLLAAKDTLR
jgi:hypothetical protein